ncbi:MAG: sulfatase-like hydrolase/transferase [Pirellulaceae bacterium]|nr:sulfatase-like hydrolase/transferase [Pirellulaceae bacterium]
MNHIVALLALLPSVALHASEAPPPPVSRPNVLLLIADDLGYADIGANGCTDFATPHIDSIADHGVRFTSGYVSAPVCSPSRAGLITGRWQTRFGHEFNHPLADRSPVGLPVSEKTAAQHFREAGYVTGHVGKWHLGNPMVPEFSPKARGFEESVWFPGQRKLPPLQFFRNGERGKADDGYVDEAMAREASAFVERHRAEPWFLYVAFLTPHQPLDTPPGSEEPFTHLADNERRKCAAMVTILDRSVGRILQTLRETGQDDRTLVVFLSDNGAPPKNGSRNTPLRGGKGTLWEGGIREPFVMQWKGVLPAGRVVDAPVTSLDLLPTALAAAGVESSTRFDGVNLLPYLTGKTAEPPHAALFWRYGEQLAVRAGDWKLTRAIDQTAAPPVLKTGLFHLRRDVSEQRDLSEDEPDKAKELQSLWEQWNAQNVKALWGGDANGSDDRKTDPAGDNKAGESATSIQRAQQAPSATHGGSQIGRTNAVAALQPSFPKAVHYRYANNFKVNPGQEDAAYRDWVADFGRTMGAELDGRVTLTADGRREIIQRFKREHPEQFLVFYSTGHIKIPTEATDPASGKLSDYGHGHWLYLPRVKVLDDIRAEAGVSELRVQMPRPIERASGTVRAEDEDVAAAKTRGAFSLRPDRGDDICLYAFGPDGTPDWDNAEQVRLVGLDEERGIIHVERGCYGTQPRAFSGQVFAAVHSEVTKFHGWFYNFSTFCPQDRRGRTAGEVWAESYARIFQPGGTSAHFDALQLDTLVEDVWPGRGSDINNNGLDDSDEDFGGVNWFAVGVCRALERLRAQLPPAGVVAPPLLRAAIHARPTQDFQLHAQPRRHAADSGGPGTAVSSQPRGAGTGHDSRSRRNVVQPAARRAGWSRGRL